MRVSRASEITIPSATGSAPPESPVPAPRATNGIRSSLQSRTTACTSSALPGSATSAGTTRRPVRPSHSYVRSCSGSRIVSVVAANRSSTSALIRNRVYPVLDSAMDAIRSFLADAGLPRGDLNELPDSPKRFADGAQYRVEIPSTEGPRCLEAVLAEAERLDVRVHRVSQGSGVFMQTDAELDEMARQAAEAQVEVSLFARPNAAWGLSATRPRASGASPRARTARSRSSRTSRTAFAQPRTAFARC